MISYFVKYDDVEKNRFNVIVPHPLLYKAVQ